MKIACLGWGSLIWDPKKLQIKGEWQPDGPELPLEYKRQSTDGRLTLVIDLQSIKLTTLWIEMETDDLAKAKESLRSREKTTCNNIGFVLSSEVSSDPVKSIIITWAKEHNLDAVVWTNLSAKFNENAIGPTLDEAVAYLKSLNGEKYENAKEYVRKTPIQINTLYRQKFETEFGWGSYNM
ncbi:hypothetical protein FFJ24_010580 [Pedobacter sp. KBS0701]|uniref:hypothetical protein n=1 Tax=Pedobacter sp. KBS0701 TaxID=2578106 RepID=UPI00110E025A|nr:hypothetical protein [Pedobacter sp. KBS0701]QDW25232.1 hypothetical protein FFJ24_010580 [Pedobacter sp. KBS0701]